MWYVLLVLMLLLGNVMPAANADDPAHVGDVQATEVARLEVKNAEIAARAAAARGDFRLLAVYGYTVEVPGVAGELRTLQLEYGLRMLEGTSDAIRDARDRAMNDNARKYAASYNQVIVKEKPQR